MSNVCLEKVNEFIVNGRTIRDLVFASQSAASEFVTGKVEDAWEL